MGVHRQSTDQSRRDEWRETGSWGNDVYRKSYFVRELQSNRRLQLDRAVRIPDDPSPITRCRRVASRVSGSPVTEQHIRNMSKYFGADVEQLIVAFHVLHCGDTPQTRRCITRGRCDVARGGLCKSYRDYEADFVDEVPDPIEIVQRRFNLGSDLWGEHTRGVVRCEP